MAYFTNSFASYSSDEEEATYQINIYKSSTDNENIFLEEDKIATLYLNEKKKNYIVDLIKEYNKNKNVPPEKIIPWNAFDLEELLFTKEISFFMILINNYISVPYNIAP